MDPTFSECARGLRSYEMFVDTTCFVVTKYSDDRLSD